MNFSFLKKKKRNHINYLELTPFRKLEHIERDDGLVDVLVPKFKNEFFIGLIPPGKSRHIRANLDEIGTSVWLLINGENKVLNISKTLQEKFGDRVEPVNDRVTNFLTQLYQNGFISFNEFTKGSKNG